MSSTLVFDESGEPLHVQQRKQIDAYRAGLEGGRPRARAARVGQPQHLRHRRRPRSCVLRRAEQERDQIGYIDENTRAVFGRSYAAEPDVAGRAARRRTRPSRPPTRCC